MLDEQPLKTFRVGRISSVPEIMVSLEVMKLTEANNFHAVR